MTLEVRHLRALALIRDAGNLMQAAERLHLTQSALSHQLRALEGRLGMELLVRKTRPLRFTPAGQCLLELAQQVLPTIDEAQKRLEMLARGTAGRLHIAIECHSCFDWLMPTMDSFRQRWPDVELDIMAGPNFDPMSLLLQGEADFVVCADPTPGAAVHYEQLFSYQALLAMANQHPLAAREFIEPRDLRDQTLIAYPVPEHRLDVFSHFLIPAQVQPRAVRSTELTVMILQLVASHRGVAALPSWVLSDYLRRDYVSARPLGGKGVWRSLYGAVRAGDAGIPYVMDFMDTARITALRELDGIRE